MRRWMQTQSRGMCEQGDSKGFQTRPIARARAAVAPSTTDPSTAATRPNAPEPAFPLPPPVALAPPLTPAAAPPPVLWPVVASFGEAESGPDEAM